MMIEEKYNYPTLKNLEDLKDLRSRFKNKFIGLCHGCFDLCHWGHVLHFAEAKEQCDILVVSITADKFVLSSKNETRPIFNSGQRIIKLNSIKFIDQTYINNEPTSSKILKNLIPDFYFKGADYINNTEHEGLKKEIAMCKELDIKHIYTKALLYSTTTFIKDVKSAY